MKTPVSKLGWTQIVESTEYHASSHSPTLPLPKSNSGPWHKPRCPRSACDDVTRQRELHAGDKERCHVHPTSSGGVTAVDFDNRVSGCRFHTGNDSPKHKHVHAADARRKRPHGRIRRRMGIRRRRSPWRPRYRTRPGPLVAKVRYVVEGPQH